MAQRGSKNDEPASDSKEESRSSDSISELTAQIRSFCEARDWDRFHGPKDLAIGLSTECNELLAQFRFLSEEEAREKLERASSRREIEDEVGDTMFFLLRFCQRCGIDPGAALHAKLAINTQRYPVKLSRARNAKYDRL